MKLSLILPVYNENTVLKRNFKAIYQYLNKLYKKDFEIIIAEDGSTDGTKELAKRFSTLKNVKLVSRSYRLGRGGALKEAIKVAKGSVIGYMDIDLSVPLRYIDKAVDKVDSGNKVVIGSRYVKGASSKRTAFRLAESFVYNSLVRVFFLSSVTDHQCGFKFWSSSYIKKSSGAIRDNHWFFDTEMLIRAESHGIKPYELPIEWREGHETKTTLSDIFYFLKALILLKKDIG